VSGDFIPQLADVLVEDNIAGLTESDDEFDDVLTQETSLPTYNKQVKASICRNKSSEICQESPICARALTSEKT
jgi:hypothetical protein